jgi:fatty-acyl-CoA synthase/long-chain acyl-CoA synthetase
MLGYFNMPEATSLAISPDGWLRTGDLGTMDERGYLRVTGRLKDMIIRGGENIYPAEVEARLIEHPAIVMASVFGLPDPRWGEVVATAIKFREGGAPAPDALREFLRVQLASHKIPTRWFCCPEFPMTGSGKVQKFRLRELVEAGGMSELEP